MENTVESTNPLKDFPLADPFDSWWPFIVAIIVGVIAAARSYFGGPHCPSEEKVLGKTIVITGGSSGIGFEVVIELLKRGGKLIIGTRQPEQTSQKIMKSIGTTSIPEFKTMFVDLASLKSVREFVKSLDDEPKIDILINNAGIAFNEFNKTDEGFESHLVTNYLSHFLLTHLLLSKLKAAESSRIINVSAQAHYSGNIFLENMNIELNYSYNKAFAQSKLALVMMARHMATILKDTNITINSMHPGIVKSTRQFQKSPLSTCFMVKLSISPWAWLFMKSPQQGAQTIIYMAVASELHGVSGKYFSNCKIINPSDKAMDKVLAEKLYEKSLELTGLAIEDSKIEAEEIQSVLSNENPSDKD